jgi:hypothetical protein
MSNTIDTAAAESLRKFAWMRSEWAFAHMVTAALAGEEWAVARFVDAFDGVHDVIPTARHPRNDAKVLAVIRATDTARPDGAIARAAFKP